MTETTITPEQFNEFWKARGYNIGKPGPRYSAWAWRRARNSSTFQVALTPSGEIDAADWKGMIPVTGTMQELAADFDATAESFGGWV